MSLFKEHVVQKTLKHQTNFSFISSQRRFNDLFDSMMRLPYWVTDSETTGLSHIHNEVILLQIGNKEKQFLIDTRVVQVDRLKEKFEDEGFVKLLQNAIFDYKMMKGSLGITMEGMFDPDIAERLLVSGLQKFGFGMDSLCLKYLGVKISKELQTSFIGHTGPFSKKQLEYGALDCVYPDCYFPQQMEKLNQQGLMPLLKLECNAIPAFGDMEYYGLILDEEKWEANILSETEKSKIARANFIKEISPYVGRDLFGEPDINPNSSEQVLRVFKQIYPRKLILDSDNKDENDNPKPGTGAGVLKRLVNESDKPDLAKYLKSFREHDKKVGTYGYSYIKHVDEKTKRFYPSIRQIGTDTGRPAARKPSMLNIPKASEYRVPWIGGPGRKILTNDYSACELRIMASMSGDPVMCKGFNDGLDYHTYTASQFITDKNTFEMKFVPGKEPGKGHWEKEILDSDGNKIRNKNYGTLVSYDFVTKDQRSVAKTINFGLAYGMGPKKLADTLKISLNEAREYIRQFNETFKVLVAWLKKQQELGYERGYSETYLGRKRYFRLPTYPKWQPEWDQISFSRTNPFDEKMPKVLKKYHSRVAAIKRESGNSPIQGGNADITKIAMYELRKFIRNYENQNCCGEYVAHIALQVYDEIIVDCPEELAPLVAKKMEEIMEEAGRRVITQVPVVTGCVIANTWVKD